MYQPNYIRRANRWATREYVEITKDFALAAAEAFQHFSSDPTEPFNFVYVSGEGATFRPGPFTPIFGRVKGETELALAGLGEKNPLFRAVSVRPGFVDPAAHDAVQPYIPILGLARRVAGVALGPAIRTLAKGNWSPTQPLGVFLTDAALGRWDNNRLEGLGFQSLGGGTSALVENVGFRRLMGLDKN